MPDAPTDTIELTHANASEIFRAIRAGELEVLNADIPHDASASQRAPAIELGSPGDTVRALTRALFHSGTVTLVRLRVRRPTGS